MVVLPFLALVAALQQGSPDFRWTGTLAAGKSIEIKGVNGDIRAAAATGDQIEVTATKRSRRSDLSSVEVKVVQDAEGVLVCALYPSRREANTCDRGHGGQNSDNNDVSVTFTVKVPAGVRFDGRTVNGSVTATGLHSDASGQTVNGGVRVETAGFADGSTVNGDVNIVMGRLAGDGPLDYSTVNGSVDLTIPASAALNVRASTTNGDITTDFPLTVSGRFGPRRLSGTIGGGGRTLSLTTVNGSIVIRKAS